MNKPRSYNYDVYQIENTMTHQTSEYTSPIAGFAFRMDAQEFVASCSIRYPGLRFIYTGMTTEEL